jgi:hypothetical protein
MIARYRQPFNEHFDESKYRAMLAHLDARAGTHVEFRVAETPCFFCKTLLDTIVCAGTALTQQLLADSTYMDASLAAIPEVYRLPSSSDHPHFMTADFGLVQQSDGSYAPRLVELQAFPSVFAFQDLLGNAYKQFFQMDSDLTFYLGGHTEDSFWRLFREVVVGEHDPDEVVLAEIHPEQQKTLPDFLLTSRKLGIPVVDVTKLTATRTHGRTQLYYNDGSGKGEGRLRPIRRIYNRVIVDELIQKQITLPFDYRDDLDVEWAGNPNWYFQVSKFSIPYLRHETVPEAVFLDEWLRGGGSERLHGDREQLLLKPLFSFAGKGIVFAPSDEELASIPVEKQRDYLLQERVNYAPVIETPFGMTQAEIRILYLWPDGTAAHPGKMEPVLSLVRLGRGKMMGVDHNRDQRWVGASAAYSV